MCGNRTVSIQEAQHEILDLPVVICSETIKPVYINKYMALKRKEDKKSNDCITLYATRKEHKDLSLSQYFYKHYVNEYIRKGIKKEDDKQPILHGIGMNYKPRHPIDFYYARGLLILHKPWDQHNFLDLRDGERVIREAEILLYEKRVPAYVYSAYHRAVNQKLQLDLTHKKKRDDDCDRPPDEDEDEEIRERHVYMNSVCHLTNGGKPDGVISGQSVDIGLNHDWTESPYNGKRNVIVRGEDYITWAKDQMKEINQTESESNKLDIPTKNGRRYTIESLSEEQKMIALATINSVWKFLTNDKDFKPLRATVMGAGGTGKSHLINTIITVVRELTGVNDSICVAAPSGGAAYNIGGCTLHKLLSIGVNQPWKEISEEQKIILRRKLRYLQVLIIDERSQLPSAVIGAAERNIRQCAFGGHNESQHWAGIPAIILVGDDYQLPPTKAEGAIKGYCDRQTDTQRAPKAKVTKQIITHEGTSHLVDTLTESVFELTRAYRQAEAESNDYIDLLERVRKGAFVSGDEKTLTSLHWAAIQDKNGFKSYVETNPKTSYLFAYNEDKDSKNNDLLAKLSNKTKKPVAKLRYVWKQSKTKPFINEENQKENGYLDKFHWQKGSVTTHTNICIGAKVAINATNHEPSWGLYNGATGTIVDIVYDNKTGPHNAGSHHLPRYVVLDMPGFRPPPEPIGPWDRNNPTVRANENLHFCLDAKFVTNKCHFMFLSPARANTHENYSVHTRML